MTAILNLREGISLFKSGRNEPFLIVRQFSLPSPGIYTLEGLNGSGKSMLIRSLTGTLPGLIKQEARNTITVEVDGKISQIRSYSNALKSGLTGVFQDDDLISSMTVFENILIRHRSSNHTKVFHYLWDLFFNLVAPPLSAAIRLIGPALPAKIQRHLEKLEPKPIDWNGRISLRSKSAALLAAYGFSPAVLDQLPSQLSGGQLAAAKIIIAQLYKNTRVLLLDEALNGVGRNRWPRFIDEIKIWSQNNNAAVIVVTHITEELQRWDPQARYEIIDGVLERSEALFCAARRRTVFPKQLTVPIFEISLRSAKETYKNLWRRFDTINSIIVICDQGGVDRGFVDQIVAFSPSGIVPRIFNTCLATNDNLESLIKRLNEMRPSRQTVFVIAANSPLRALASLASLTMLHVNAAGVVVIPTSVSDIVSVVVSTNVQSTIQLGPLPTDRVKISAVFNPDAILIAPDMIAGLPTNDIKCALMPCVKIATLFDRSLFKSCDDIMHSALVEKEDFLKILYGSVLTLNEICELNPQLRVISRVLQFSNFHASVIESLSEGQIDSGGAHLLGMLLEASISGSLEVAKKLRKVAVLLNISKPNEMLSKWGEAKLLYESGFAQDIEGKAIFSQLSIPSIGYFGVNEFRARIDTAKGAFDRNLPAYANKQAEEHILPFSISDIHIGAQKMLASLTN